MLVSADLQSAAVLVTIADLQSAAVLITIADLQSAKRTGARTKKYP
jgi:hypothetical protein